MTRSIVSGLLGLLSVAIVGSLPLACQSGGVGDPCIPEDEYDPGFAGFKVTEENIESRSFQCQTRICLVNHFQGRSSCPLGQAAPVACDPADGGTEVGGNTSCQVDEACTQAAVYAPECDSDADCPSGVCDPTRKICGCSDSSHCPGGATGNWICEEEGDGGLQVCRSYVCFNPTNGCQTAEAGTDNEGKACCVPGTNTPVAAPVCGQCGSRNAEAAVYCSCRCGAAEGSNNPEDENFNFCECPDGFECSEIRRDVGLGDPLITGKYCIKRDTTYDSADANGSCGSVAGRLDSACAGQLAQ
ncbi:uncharacterized protein CMC5_058430 [Chondromyces crocatus]|uniref:EGF-like domain-containing protein n=1 Tax=Chondromyces crocatus TaxID=52 RepID=A0A0K1ELG0_CHOCO|nr:uncharacterized protein CMC5_058430 [Chondromyces crocatus]